MRVLLKSINKQDDNPINLTPMLDVIFIVMVFFIMTSSIQQNDIAIQRQADTASAQQRTYDIQLKITKKHMRINNKLFVDTKSVCQHFAIRAQQSSDITLTIDAADTVLVNHLMQLMNCAQSAGIDQIFL